MQSITSWLLLVIFWCLVGIVLSYFLDAEWVAFGFATLLVFCLLALLIQASIYYLQWAEAWPFIPQ